MLIVAHTFNEPQGTKSDLLVPGSREDAGQRLLTEIQHALEVRVGTYSALLDLGEHYDLDLSLGLTEPFQLGIDHHVD